MKNNSILALKLKRLKIKYSEEDGKIVIGKPKIDLNSILLIVVPFVASCAIFILFGEDILNAEVRRGKLMAILVFLFGASIFNLTRTASKWKKNTHTKTLVNKTIKIKTEDEEVNFDNTNVKQFKVLTKEVSEDLYEGTLYLVDTNNNLYPILGFDDENEKLIIDDLNWFIDYLEKYIELKSN